MEALKLLASVIFIVMFTRASAVDAKDIFYGLCILLCGFIAHDNK